MRLAEREHIVRFLLERAQVIRRGVALSLDIPRGDGIVDRIVSEHSSTQHSGEEHSGEELSAASGKAWTLEGVMALDFMGALLDDPGLAHLAKGSPLLQEYERSTRALPGWDDSSTNAVRVQKLCEDAVLPEKQRVSDSGYDLTLIAIRKRFGHVTLYGTGLVVQAPDGYYFDVVARSSIIKTGHMLANNVGVIDRAYRGELMVPVVKLDPDAADLNLPVRLAQLIPRPIVHFPIEKVEQLTYTSRGAGGFGSTG